MKPARQAREAAGRSVTEACRAARISLSTLRKIEHGAPASERVMRALAECYGTNDFPFRRHRPATPGIAKGGRSVARKPGARAAASPAGRGEAR